VSECTRSRPRSWPGQSRQRVVAASGVGSRRTAARVSRGATSLSSSSSVLAEQGDAGLGGLGAKIDRPQFLHGFAARLHSSSSGHHGAVHSASVFLRLLAKPKVSGTKMFWQTNGFGRHSIKPTFASSSPICPATESVSPAHLSLWESQQVAAAGVVGN
jgi:hypothetical protein